MSLFGKRCISTLKARTLKVASPLPWLGLKPKLIPCSPLTPKLPTDLQSSLPPHGDAAQTADISAILHSISDVALKFVPPTQDTDVITLRKEVLLAYIAIWHAKAETNIWAAISLPRPEMFDHLNEWHIRCKTIVDRSAADFKYMSDILSKVSVADIQASAYSHLYQEVIGTLGPLVGDTSEHFVRVSQQT